MEGPAVRTADELRRVLRSSAPYMAKLDALQVVQDSGDPAMLTVVRERVPEERDSFVLSKIAALLGSHGELTDGPLLVGMLESPEPRVVSNSLEALDRLGILLDIERLESFTRSDDARVAGTALASLSTIQPLRALQIIRDLYPAKEADHRRAFLHTLQPLAGRQEARDLLVSLIAVESRTPLLKLIAGALTGTFVTLRRHEARRIVGQLQFVRGTPGADRSSLVEQLLHDLCTAMGWVREDIDAILQGKHPEASEDETIA